MWKVSLISLELLIILDQSFRVISVTFFVVEFNLLIWELGHFTFTLLHWVIFILILCQSKINQNILMVLCENSKMDSFSYSRIKNFVFLAVSLGFQ